MRTVTVFVERIAQGSRANAKALLKEGAFGVLMGLVEVIDADNGRRVIAEEIAEENGENWGG